MKNVKRITTVLATLIAITYALPAWSQQVAEDQEPRSAQTVGQQTVNSDAERADPTLTHTRHKTVKVNGVDIFYREAGPANAPTILLLHGYPTSSHMFRNLIQDLSDRYHLLAPDYPGYGRSEQPPMAEFD